MGLGGYGGVAVFPDGFSWNNATLVATDEFWLLVNPSRNDLLVEVEPPVRVTFVPRRTAAAAIAASKARPDQAGDAAGAAAEPPEPSISAEEAWQMMMDRMRMEWIEWVRPLRDTFGWMERGG